jgi:hypothetical protein
MSTSRISIPSSAVPMPPFASSVLLPGSILTHMSCPIHSTLLALFDTHAVLHNPLGMGVPIVFHHVVNQPHTSSPHFASFPYRLPDHLFMVLFFLPAPPQDHEPSISSTINLPIYKPIFISPTSYRNSPMGPPPFISFPRKLCPPWGTHFTLGHPFLYLYIFPQIIHYLLYKCPFLLSSPLVTCFLLATRNPCHPWLEHYFSSTLAGIVHIFRVLHRSLTSTL